MNFRDVAELITITTSTDGVGGYETTETARFVFANKKSVKYAEFYTAHNAGFRPEIIFQIRSVEYQDENRIRYNGKDYDIIRTFSKNDEMIELICAKRTEVIA